MLNSLVSFSRASDSPSLSRPVSAVSTSFCETTLIFLLVPPVIAVLLTVYFLLVEMLNLPLVEAAILYFSPFSLATTGILPELISSLRKQICLSPRPLYPILSSLAGAEAPVDVTYSLPSIVTTVPCGIVN